MSYSFRSFIKTIFSGKKQKDQFSNYMDPGKIRVIGHWHWDHEPQYPDPGRFVDSGWDEEEKEQVIQFLENRVLMSSFRGYSWCRFRCGTSRNGFKSFSDGYYYWPEGFVHYVREHQVKPPDEFIRHVLLGPTLPDYDKITSLKDRDSDSVTLDYEWWLAQKGESEEPVETYTTMKDSWTQPYSVHCDRPTLVKLEKGKYQIFFTGNMGSLITDTGYGYTLLDTDLANLLKELIPDISLESIQITNKDTGEQWANYFSLTYENIYLPELAYANKTYDVSGNKIWIGEKGGLYVSEGIKEKLENAGFGDLSFSR